MSTVDGRVRCYGCFRPRDQCFCNLLPVIANQTEVLILQHRREQFHPFNTARLLRRSLQNSSTLVEHKDRLKSSLSFKPGAVLLYPGPEAELLTQSCAASLSQLVVIDGTWHHAKTFVRDIAALRELPRYRLAPSEPSQYRIRLEPNLQALSTVEAVVAALRVLEPQTEGFDELLGAFKQMVDRQCAHPRSNIGRHVPVRPNRTFRNVPLAFLHQPEHIVVAYGETSQGGKESSSRSAPPVYWVAERLISGERFMCKIASDTPLSDSFLNHLQLTRDDFAEAVSLECARARWNSFLRKDDQISVYHSGAVKLLEHLGTLDHSCLILKSIQFSSERRNSTLDDVVAVHGLPVGETPLPGRAGRRLANAVALVHYLRKLALQGLLEAGATCNRGIA